MPPNDPPGAPEPWDRGPGESSKAYEAFLAYRNAGPSRSLRNLADRGQTVGGFRLPSLEGWSSRFGWVDRCRAWDAHMAALEQAAAEKRAIDRAALWASRRDDDLERHFAIASRLEASVGQLLTDPNDKTLLPSGLDPYEVKAAAGTFETARKIKADIYRQALPQQATAAGPTETIVEPAGDPDLAAAAWEAIHKRLKERGERRLDPPDD